MFIKSSVANLLLSIASEVVTFLINFVPFFTSIGFLTAEDLHLDDLYTRYRQRLRKSLFRAGLWISLAACVVSILIGVICQQVSKSKPTYMKNERNKEILKKIY